MENAFFRYKSIIGDGLRALSPGGRATEAVIACNILNHMTELAGWACQGVRVEANADSHRDGQRKPRSVPIISRRLGEVYRARDTKLDRDVALKVLPQAFTDDPDRLARFEREAKVVAGEFVRTRVSAR